MSVENEEANERANWILVRIARDERERCELETRLRLANVELEGARTDLARFKAEDELNPGASNAAERVVDLEAKVAELTAKIESRRSDEEALVGEVERLRVELRGARSAKSVAEVEVEKARNALAAAERERDEARAKVKRFEDDAFGALLAPRDQGPPTVKPIPVNPGTPGPGTPPAPAGTCCRLRAKVALFPMTIPEEICGVPSAELADVMLFDQKSPLGKPVITFRFCPWCGKPWTRTGSTFEIAP